MIYHDTIMGAASAEGGHLSTRWHGPYSRSVPANGSGWGRQVLQGRHLRGALCLMDAGGLYGDTQSPKLSAEGDTLTDEEHPPPPQATKYRSGLFRRCLPLSLAPVFSCPHVFLILLRKRLHLCWPLAPSQSPVFLHLCLSVRVSLPSTLATGSPHHPVLQTLP